MDVRGRVNFLQELKGAIVDNSDDRGQVTGLKKRGNDTQDYSDIGAGRVDPRTPSSNSPLEERPEPDAEDVHQELNIAEEVYEHEGETVEDEWEEEGEDVIGEGTPMLRKPAARKLARFPPIDEDDGYGDSFDMSTKMESIEDDDDENGRLARSNSLSRLHEENEVGELQNHQQHNHYQTQNNRSAPHPGHRYYTPQPAKRKALKPQTPPHRPPLAEKPQTPPVLPDARRSHNLKLKIPERSGTFGNGYDSESRNGSAGDSFDSGTGSASAGVRRAIRPPSSQVRNGSTPSTPGSSVFSPETPSIRVTPEYSDGELIQPRRKAPRPPLERRKSDPLSNSRNRRSAVEQDTSANDLDFAEAGQNKRITRNRTLEGGIAPSDLEKYATPRHRFFTPQPSRRKFSFRDGQNRKSTGNSSPLTPVHLQQYTRSPVERLAKQKISNKHQDRLSLGTDVVTPESSPVSSPVRTPIKTPTKPPPPPPSQNTVVDKESYHIITEDEIIDAQRNVGGRRPRSMSSGSMPGAKRRPLPSVPRRPRSGSTSKVGQDIPTVPGKGIQKRRNRQSAPAGRMASFLSDSNSSLHSKTPAPSGSSAQGEKRRETLREELLRSLLVDSATKNVSAPVKKREASMDGDKSNGLNQAENSLKIDMVRQKSGYDGTDSPPTYSPLSTKSSVFSNGGTSPSPPPSAGNSPTRRHPRRRNKSSLSSLVSMPKNLVASSELLNDILLSDRGTHKKLKGVVGFLVGIILGGLLFLGLYYGLAYGLYAALIITAISTIFMSLCLAFTVRARCVAALMVPTICTSRGRAAFLAFIVALLLRGPVHNIYMNANEVSDSMSCSAELAYNQSREIQEAAQRVLDNYVQGILGSIDNIQDAVREVGKVFEPVEEGLGMLNDGLANAGRELGRAADACNDIIGSAGRSCTSNLNRVYYDCQEFMKKNVPNPLQMIGQVCDVFKASGVCSLLNVGGICQAPAYIDNAVNDALSGTRTAMQSIIDTFDADVDFSRYYERRLNSSTTAEHIQEAIKEELDQAYSYVELVLLYSDKILALSFVWLCIKSYMYHSSYRTKDSFDNQYITAQFKKLDASRKDRGVPSILPLKKNERTRLIDVTSLRLCQSEKGYFKFGLSTVVFHSIIAGLVMFVDFGLYWLLLKIQEHGDVQIETSGELGSDVEIEGTGVVAELVRVLFNEGFQATTAFNTSLDTTICLPEPVKPNHQLAITISVMYIFTIVMVLSQAYAQRLLRYIAAYYYPEREVERIAYLYGHTLQKRQTLLRMLRDKVRINKKEQDASNRISISAYLMRKYPCCKGLFIMCGAKQRQCLGCLSPDDGLLVFCSDQDCEGMYCEECARALNGMCSICDGGIEMGKVPLEDEHKL
ncbi:uncharacterized protein [Diadema antillarum]|uniref:uncharacterized protein n=1 Tax=Diadema antillarum TaxID=105358 RepID=UPI003A8B791F